MNINMQSVRSYLGQAAQTAKELSTQAAVAAKDLSSQVIGAKCLRDYSMQGLTASAGPGCMWNIYAARSKREGTSNPLASVWIVDKRAALEASRGNARLAEVFLQLCRKDAANLAKLKHPNVVRLLEPFEETRSQLVMVTEAVTASLADVIKLRKAAAVAGGGAGSLHLSELEIKHGFLQVAEGLHFLHTQANQIHRGISPEAICVTAGGAWKLCGFGFAVLANFGGSSPADMSFDYSDSSNCLTAQALKPSLSLAAPELVNNAAGNIFSAADVFSLGLVMYELIGEKQLLDVSHNLYEYRSKIASFEHLNLSAVPYGLQQLLGQMLLLAPAARPSAISITGSEYFQGDQMLRALRFMETMLQRDTKQKVAFLNDLTTFWDKFDDRLLRLKVMPRLLEEVRSEQLQQLALPLVINILRKQDPQDFADTTAPALAPIYQTATGETLLLLIRNTPTMLKCMPRACVTSMLVPLLAKAADQGEIRAQEDMLKQLPAVARHTDYLLTVGFCHLGEIRAQEDMLKQLPAVARQTDYATFKAELLPRVHSLCLKTTSASVRMQSLTCMAAIAASLDEEEAGKMLQTARKVSSVDHTASTVMCVLGLGEAISKQYGLEIAAKEVLPMLSPLLILPSLSGQHFTSAMRIVKTILNQIETKRAGQLDMGEPSTTHTTGSSQHASNAGIPKAGMPSWDTDSAPPQSEVTSRQSSAGPQSGFSNLANPHTQPAAITPLSQPKRRTAPQHDPLAQSSWQGSSMRAEGSAADPFAVLPATIAQPGTSLQGSDLFLHPHSMLSAPGTSGHLSSVQSHAQPMKMACAPGDQLANVLHSDDQSSLFMDSAWRDPNLNSAAYTPAAPSSASLPGNMQSSTFNNSHQAVLQPLPSLGGHGTSLSAASNAASDPFSQLSLSRMPVGNAPPQQYGVDVQPGSSSLLGMGSTWPSTATSKLASSGHSISAGMSARRGAAPLERPSHDQPRTSQTASFSLI